MDGTEILHDFLNDTRPHLDACFAVIRRPSKQRTDHELKSVGRHLHTIKGNAGFLNLTRIIEAAHGCEESLSRVSAAPQDPQQLAALKRQMLCLQRLVDQLQRAISHRSGKELTLEEFVARTVAEIPNQARAMGKRVRPTHFVEVCEGAQRHRGLVRETLTHAIRNALAHGIESSDDRERMGKSATGRIAVRVSAVNDELVISVSDDGQGIDVEAVRSSAIERQVRGGNDVSADASISDLITSHGFTTSRSVNAFSGRGVGLAAINTLAKRARGRLDIESTPGCGTTIRLRIPFKCH